MARCPATQVTLRERQAARAMAAPGTQLHTTFFVGWWPPVDVVENLAGTCLALPVGRDNASFSQFSRVKFLVHPHSSPASATSLVLDVPHGVQKQSC